MRKKPVFDTSANAMHQIFTISFRVYLDEACPLPRNRRKLEQDLAYWCHTTNVIKGEFQHNEIANVISSINGVTCLCLHMHVQMHICMHTCPYQYLSVFIRIFIRI